MRKLEAVVKTVSGKGTGFGLRDAYVISTMWKLSIVIVADL
jgi:hypothetical protein